MVGWSELLHHDTHQNRNCIEIWADVLHLTFTVHGFIMIHDILQRLKYIYIYPGYYKKTCL